MRLRQAAARDSADGTGGLLVATPTRVELGVVAAGGHKEGSFWVSNPRTAPVEVTTFMTSCPCLRIEAPRSAVGPGERMLFHAMLDLSSEASFSGALQIEVKGLAKSGALAFAAVAEVNVTPE